MSIPPVYWGKPPNPNNLIGAGCDGIDNDCDSNFLNPEGNKRVPVTKRVDECDENQVPPTLLLLRILPLYLQETTDDGRTGLEVAIEFYNEYTRVGDNCVPLDMLRKDILNVNVDANTGNGQLDVRVCDERCRGEDDFVEGEPGRENAMKNRKEDRNLNSRLTFEYLFTAYNTIRVKLLHCFLTNENVSKHKKEQACHLQYIPFYY